jgi:FkbM family methyltransferase
MALTDEQAHPPTLKRAVQKVARTLGLHIGRYPPVDSLAYHVRTLLEVLGIDCVVDVGAHVGEYGSFLRELGYRGEIYSFEPSGASFEALRRAGAGDPTWHVENAALGREAGEKDMNIYKGTVFNSFLEANEYGAERFGEATTLERTERVRVRTLASVIEECLAARPEARIFVKSDTQGYDLHVFDGAGARLEAVLALQTEQATRPTYQGMPSFTEALAHLLGHGYELTGMFPVARDRDHLRVIEFDCVMRRSPAATSS